MSLQRRRIPTTEHRTERLPPSFLPPSALRSSADTRRALLPNSSATDPPIEPPSARPRLRLPRSPLLPVDRLPSLLPLPLPLPLQLPTEQPSLLPLTLPPPSHSTLSPSFPPSGGRSIVDRRAFDVEVGALRSERKKEGGRED
ncbi:hypothetical protein BCR35DRAFT_11148 [Leucosporidium creatinivorum]|uniref:Uncharacterized protein n=1 Tax=Leucosporidium creatinivorum TaxID=106004 RepID=A0A1Y2G4N1_9BASI|nr:hypothetical protein BCR35DRAFT_11148 [Leucosporidium creatinivorum]